MSEPTNTAASDADSPLDDLPPLPEPAFSDTYDDGGDVLTEDAYSDQQMIDYACAALTAAGVPELVEERDRLRLERDNAMETLHEEIAANLAFRTDGGALPDEDMPTFCARLIAERDRLAVEVERLRKIVSEKDLEICRLNNRSVLYGESGRAG